MSEVTKLYENAEVKKQIPKVCSSNELYCKECEAHIEDAIPYCKNAEYPPFTAEKQLELIKWLGKNKNGFGLFGDSTNGLSCHCDFYWEWFDQGFYAEDFENGLAGLINTIWQDLTDAERTQIKNILESEVRE